MASYQTDYEDERRWRDRRNGYRMRGGARRHHRQDDDWIEDDEVDDEPRFDAASRGADMAERSMRDIAMAGTLPAQIGVAAIESTLQAWREFADVTVDLVRQQQDLMLQAARSPLPRRNGVEETLRRGVREPAHRAARAWRRMGEEALDAERRAQRRFERERFD
jgi:hypothetical protein